MRPRGDDDDDDDGDVVVAVSERPLHLTAELERPNAERRDGVREADEAVAREVPTPENATARGIRHGSSDDILDLNVFAMDYLDVLTTSERAPATRYCSSCRKHLVEAHFRSPATKTCVVCLRMHKTYQRRRRRLKNKRQRRQSDD
jgi:hypothetical protein